MKKLVLLVALLSPMAGVLVGAQGGDHRDYFNNDREYWEQLTPREKLILIAGFRMGIEGILYIDHGSFVDDKEGRGELIWMLVKPYDLVCAPEELVKMLDALYRQNIRAGGREDIPSIIMDISGVGEQP